MNWTRVDSLAELFAFGAGRPISYEQSGAPGLPDGANDAARVAFFADGNAIAVVADVEIRGPYSEVTPDVDVFTSLRCYVGVPTPQEQPQ